VASEHTPDLTLFFDILHTLEAIHAPYMVIGAFAATMYGSTRTTFDIDIVVDLGERHISLLAAKYPLPRYYADPVQMRDSIRLGIMFNIIDTSRGDKADLVPLTMEPRYRQAFRRRVRQRVDAPDVEPFDIWCARADDVIIGKLMAWQQGRSRKHESDIREMLVFHYLNPDSPPANLLDEGYVSFQIQALGADVMAFWHALRDSARKLADEATGHSDVQAP
jgi:hypothetical protein